VRGVTAVGGGGGEEGREGLVDGGEGRAGGLGTCAARGGSCSRGRRAEGGRQG
jgi:hypothetical protein